MNKSVKKMGTEALAWEIVRIEFQLEAYREFRAALLDSIERMTGACPEAGALILSAIHQLETNQRERMNRLEVEQACRMREISGTERDTSVLHYSKT